MVHWVKSMAGSGQQVDSPVGAFLWMVLSLVLHQLKSMARSDQQVDSPVGAAVGAAAVGGALGQEHGRVWPAG